MKDRLAVVGLGNPASGKSTTWNHLFSLENTPTTVRTGSYLRRLYLNKSDWIQVFLVSGSPEERNIPLNQILPSEGFPQILLCSIQYLPQSKESFSYLLQNGYDLYVVWLNPGYSDNGYDDDHKIVKQLLEAGATLLQVNGKLEPIIRIREIRQFLYGWATVRNCIQTDYV